MFVLERRGRHKPLSSYFEDAVLDREGSVDRETESQLQGPRPTQERPERDSGVGVAVGSSVTQAPTNSMAKAATPDDEDSVTGKPKFGH